MSTLDLSKSDDFNVLTAAELADQEVINKAFQLSDNFYRKFRDKLDIQQLFSNQEHSWMLNQSELKTSLLPPLGLANETTITDQYNQFLLLLPLESGYPHLDFREVHQIVRELSIGMFVFNQTPSISLLPNFDRSTSISISSPYVDSLIGQALVAVDYEMKTLWHGSHFDNKDSRQKFNDRWRNLVHLTAAGVPDPKLNFQKLFTTPGEATGNGMKDIANQLVYEDVYANRFPTTDQDMQEFMENHESYLMYGVFSLAKVDAFQNIIFPHTVLDVNTVVDSPDIPLEVFNRVQSRLRQQSQTVLAALEKRPEIRRMLSCLKLVAALIPLFTAMKKSGKVVNMNRLFSVTNFGSSDELRTEKEFPPHILGKNFKCDHFDFEDDYFGLHGRMQFDPETGLVKDAEDLFGSQYDALMEKAKDNLNSLFESNNVYADSYPVPVETVNGREMSLILLETEPLITFQGSAKPIWVGKLLDDKLKKQEKSSGVKEEEVKEFFKRKYGFKKAMNYMIPFNGVRVAAELGLIAAFQYFIEIGSQVIMSKEDEKGLSLIHLAAIKNQVSILVYLLDKGADVDVRRYQHFAKQSGSTPLHFACRSGSSDVVDCLLSARAKTNLKDPNGWFPIHCASYYDHPSIVVKLLAREPKSVDVPTLGKLKETPLHLAASSGALKSTRVLLKLGASHLLTTSSSDNVIHLAALNGHNNIIKFYIERDLPGLPVWNIIVTMLSDSQVHRVAAALKALEYLSTAEETYWKLMLEAGVTPALVAQMKSSSADVVALCCSIVNNISTHTETRVELDKANAVPILIELLGSSEPDIQSRSAIIQTDLAFLSKEVSDKMREHGLIEKIFEVLDEGTIEDVLINVMMLTVPLCRENEESQTLLMDFRIDMIHMDLLASDSEDVKAAAATSIAAVARGHPQNQCALVYTGILPPLIELMKIRNLQVQITGAGALEALATNNPETQAIILSHEAHVPLIKLLKVWSIEVKEQAAFALWALAGQALMQQKTVAGAVGIPQIIDMILLPSDKLKYVGCLYLEAYSRNDVSIQKKLVEQNAVSPLVRLLRSPSLIRDVQLVCIKAIGTLGVGVANRNNVLTQTKMADESAIPSIATCLADESKDDQVRVEAALALSKLVLNNSRNLDVLKATKLFSYKTILRYLDHRDLSISMIAGLAIATFAFNNIKQQFAIKSAGGVAMKHFRVLLEHPNETYQATGAFLTTVLAKLIVDQDEVSLTSRSVNLLAELLKSNRDETKIKASKFVASLCHTRAGIPQVFVTLGVVEQCVKNLQSSSNVEVKRASANALGYLSFNALASRVLFATCRARPMLFTELMSHLESDAKISDSFTENFNMEMTTGCPMHHLEVMGGPPIKVRRDYSDAGSTRPNTRSSGGNRSRPTTSGTVSNGTGLRESRRLKSASLRPLTSTPTPGRSTLRPVTSQLGLKKDLGLFTKTVKIADA